MYHLAPLIAGQRVVGGPKRDVTNPFDGKTIATISNATSANIEHALTAAERGARQMATMPAYRRSEILTAAARLLEERRESVARDLCLESGKPIRDARLEVERCVITLRVSGLEASRIDGVVLPLDNTKTGAGRLGLTRRYPLGVITAISPFNFPLNLPAHKVGPGLAAGNSLILKPAPRTPLSANHLVEILHEAGCPVDALSLVFADSPELDPLVMDPRVKMVSFTGSATVGWNLRGKASKKKVTLELGGNGAAIVHEDADLDVAVARCIAGSFTFAGQVCIRSQRLIVHESILTRFTDLFLSRASSLRRGNPLDGETEMGPMIDAAAASRAFSWVREALDAGAVRRLGGEPEGAYMPPTVLTGVPTHCRAYSEEIFAPVVTLESYRTLDEAIERVNDSKYGLQAGIFTNQLSTVIKVFDRLAVGGVIHDDVPMFRSDVMPYGGVKDSGFGREGVRYAIEDMTELRILVLRWGNELGIA